MIMKRSISSLLFLILFIINIQHGVSTKCYVCSSSNEKDDCWASPEKAPQEECGASPATPTPPPGTESPGTGTPGTAAPGTPGTAAPGTPGTAAPGTPGTAAPGTPGTAAPGTPGTAAPGTPGTAAPGTPGTAAPGTPGTAAPGTPGTAAPGTPGTAAPGTPGTAAPGTPGTAAPGTPGTAAPGTPGTPGTAAPGPAQTRTQTNISADDELIYIESLLHDYKKRRNITDSPTPSRSRRSADNEWECLKLVTKDGDKKTVERKCAKKTEKSCENKKNTDGESCNLCSDKELCNSASSLKLQLIPAFLSVFGALFLSSR